MANSVSTKNKWVQVVGGILLAVAGLVFFILAIVLEPAEPGSYEASALEWILGALIGAVCLVYGLLMIIGNVLGNKDKKFPMELVTGSLIIAIGAVFAAVVPHIIGDSLTWFVGAFLALIGLCLVIRSVYLLIRKIKIGWFLLFLICGVVVLAAGVLAIVGFYNWDLSWLPVTIYCILGIIVAAVGVYLVVVNCRKKA